MSKQSTSRPRVVVAMSGGVDSSVTAALLQEQGWEVVGVTLQLYDHGAAMARPGACCAGQDILDARRVADTLGIPHYVLNYEDIFARDVIDDFVATYRRGETPIPCVRCNQTVKFRDLLTAARDLGAEALATGHYVRRLETERAGAGDGGGKDVTLHTGLEAARDQSYFLFATTRAQLAFLRFPLGDRTKAETRALAARFALPVARKPDSQDICFVPQGSYTALLAAHERVAHTPSAALEPGPILHLDGRVLGQHKGTAHYTIGQRRGLGLGGRVGEDTEPLFVVALDPASRQVVVGPKSALACTEVRVRALNWLGGPLRSGAGCRVSVKLRSTQPAVPASIWCDRSDPTTDLATASESGTTAIVRLDTPVYGVAPGQACVCYQGSQVLGGGWIAQAQALTADTGGRGESDRGRPGSGRPEFGR